MKKFLVLSIIFGAVFTSGCSSSNSSGDDGFGIGAAAVDTLPSVLATSLMSAVRQNAAMTSGNISSFSTLATFFKLECYMPGSESFCPAGVDYTTGGDMNPYKLTSFTLIGSIYHADMYSGGLKTSCDGTPTTITAGSFVPATTGGNAAKYILDYYNLLTCGSQSTENVAPGTKYQVYSADSAGTYQATLTSRYRNPYNGDADPGQNDIFQVYVGLSGETPALLAFNYAGADSMFQRTVLLADLVNHKFAVKHSTYNSTSSSTAGLTAVGKGGINRATGVANEGSYYTKFDDGATGCVNNQTGAFGADDSACTAGSVPLPGSTWTNSDSIATYLSLSAGDKTRLAAFLAFFNDDALLGSDTMPHEATTDPETNFPKSITF